MTAPEFRGLRARPSLAITRDALLLELAASSRERDDLRRDDAPLQHRLAAFHRHEDARLAMRSFHRLVGAAAGSVPKRPAA